MALSDRKKVLFVQNNLGENSAFMEMLKHLRDNPDAAVMNFCPERMLKELDVVLQTIGKE